MSQSPVYTEFEWYLVFTKAKFDHWIWRLVDKNMGHVYAIRDLNDYQWLVVQPRTNIVEIKIMLKCRYPELKMITGPDAKIIKVTARPQQRAIGCLNWFNCVEQIKALIGVRSFWTWTPKQLYNGIMRGEYNGGR